MKNRRAFLHLAAGTAALSALWRLARAQPTYPIRPVRIIAGSAAGSAPDILARLIAE
jgi:tripartite-type tricarboxylate transporter receptor subunit TctC